MGGILGGGVKGYVAPPSQIIAGEGGLAPLPPLPTPMIFHSNNQISSILSMASGTHVAGTFFN